MKGTLKQIALAELKPSKDNPRNIKDMKKDLSFVELCESVASLQAVIMPLIVTPNSKGYKIAAGERRFHAAKEAKLETVPAIVYEGDLDPFVITLIENSHRKDLSLVEQLDQITKLQKKFGKDPVTLSEILAVPKAEVARRIQASELSPDIIETLHEMSVMPSMGHLAVLATMPEHLARDICYDQWVFEDNTPKQFEQFVNNNYRYSLKKAIWDLDNPAVAPDTVACNECPDRSDVGLNRDLFDMVGDSTEMPPKSKAGKCLNRTCWRKKLHAITPEDKLGEDTSSGQPEKTKGVPKTMAQRKSQYKGLRLIIVMRSIHEMFGEYPCPEKKDTPALLKSTPTDLLLYAIAFGVELSTWDTRSNSIDKIVDALREGKCRYQERWGEKATTVTPEVYMAQKIAGNALGKINPKGFTAIQANEREKTVKYICEIYGIDFDALFEAATKEKPYPKSWKTLNTDGTKKDPKNEMFLLQVAALEKWIEYPGHSAHMVPDYKNVLVALKDGVLYKGIAQFDANDQVDLNDRLNKHVDARKALGDTLLSRGVNDR